MLYNVRLKRETAFMNYRSVLKAVLWPVSGWLEMQSIALRLRVESFCARLGSNNLKYLAKLVKSRRA